MNFIRQKEKSSFLLVLVSIFILVFSSFAFAAETVEMTDLDVVKLLVSQASLYDLENNILTYSSIEDIVAELQKVDKYARYYTAEEYQYMSESNQGSKFGIGINIQEENGQLIISGFVEGKPAATSGLQVGDILIKIGDVDLRNKPIEAVSYYIGKNMADQIKVVVLRNGEEKTFLVEPTIIETSSIYYGMLENKIGYIQIIQFTDRTGIEFGAAIDDLKKNGMQCFMLDLRSCPGGTLDGVIDVAGYLIPESPFVFIHEKDGVEYYYRSHGELVNLPFVVLVNENTASAAELLSGSIQDTGNSVIIGTKTYGKGIVQGTYQLPSGAGMKLTTSKYFTRNYQDIDKQKGISPDIVESDVNRQTEIGLNILRNHVQYGDSITVTLGSNILKTAQGDIKLDYPVYTKEDRAMLPLRQVVESLGGLVYSVDDTIYVQANGKSIEINAQNGTILYRGNVVDFPVEFPNGVTTISVRVLTELLGFDVVFYGYNDSIRIQ